MTTAKANCLSFYCRMLKSSLRHLESSTQIFSRYAWCEGQYINITIINFFLIYHCQAVHLMRSSKNFFQPILDICLYIYELTDAIGSQGPLTMLGYLAVSGFILTRYCFLLYLTYCHSFVQLSSVFPNG